MPREDKAPVYPLSTTLSKYGNCTHLLKIKNKLKISCFYKLSWEKFLILAGVVNKTITPIAPVGYKMIIANSALRTLSVGYLPSHIQGALVE